MLRISQYSTGISSFDALVKEVRPGDSYVFSSSELRLYEPFARSLFQYCRTAGIPVTLIRIDGTLDRALDVSARIVDILDAGGSFASIDVLIHKFQSHISLSGKGTVYIFDNVQALKSRLGADGKLESFFVQASKFLSENNSLSYWSFIGDSFSEELNHELRRRADTFVELKEHANRPQLHLAKLRERIFAPEEQCSELLFEGAEGLLLSPIVTHPGETHQQATRNRELREIQTQLQIVHKGMVQHTEELHSAEAIDDLEVNADHDKILRSALKKTIKTIGASGGAVILCDRRMQKFRAAAHQDANAVFLESFTKRETWDSLIDKPSRFIRPLIVSNTDKSNACNWLTGQHFTSGMLLLIAPLRAHNRLLGMMLLTGELVHDFSERDLSMLSSIGNQMALTITNTDLYHQVKSSQIRYQSLFESAKDGIFLVDIDSGKIIEVNAQAATLTGYSRRHLRTKRFWDLTLPERTPEVRAHFRNHLHGTETFFEMPLLQRAGSCLVTELYMNLVESNGTRFVQCLMRDITTRVESAKKLEETIEAAEVLNCELTHKNKELQEIARSKTEFLNFVSHELRTPLLSMQWAADRLKRLLDTITIEDSDTLINILLQDSNKLSSLVEQLLEFSRIEAKKLQLHKKEHNIVPLIDNIIRSKKDRVKGKQIQFHLKKIDLVPDSLFDPDKIEIVLNNLIDNSLKYSFEKGTIIVSIVSRSTTPPSLEVRVQDDGVGIPETELDRVFDTFYRGSKTGNLKTPGTGLGLSIAKAIIEAHGGKIWAESGSGRGCTMAFTLPIASSVAKA